MSAAMSDEQPTIGGTGTFTLPEGMTPEEAERLVAEADEQRRKEREKG